MGQNIAHGNLAANNELSFVKDWYDDVAYFNSSDVESFKLYVKYSFFEFDNNGISSIYITE